MRLSPSFTFMEALSMKLPETEISGQHSREVCWYLKGNLSGNAFTGNFEVQRMVDAMTATSNEVSGRGGDVQGITPKNLQSQKRYSG